MRIDFFTIQVQAGAETTEELNRLLSSARILTVDRQFVADGSSSFWSVCVVSQSGPSRGTKSLPAKRGSIDYRDVLSAEDFGIYAKLRDLRKQLAEREGVPPYAVFTNEQLAAIVQGRVNSLTALKRIDGIGDARVDKYGMSVVALMTSLAGAPGTAGPRTATGTRPTIGTTTLASVLPELLTGVDAPGLTRLFSPASRLCGLRQNRKTASALVGGRCPAKVRWRSIGGWHG